MNKTFWAIVVAIIVIFFGIVIFNKDDPSTSGTNGKQATNHIIGEGKSGVTLTEYGDFECPYCGQYYPLVKQVIEKYNDQIHFQFRHLPLLQVHKNAFAAARASEAADKQGKFWEMYDLIYQNQQTWSQNSDAVKQFEQYATQLGLNLEQYKRDAASSEANEKINADISAFKQTKEQMSTPTFFLDGKKITATSVEEFSKLIDEAIAAKQKQ